MRTETAKAIRRDLEAAGIPYETDEGVSVDDQMRLRWRGAWHAGLGSWPDLSPLRSSEF
jgi:hypothetical protein